MSSVRKASLVVATAAVLAAAPLPIRADSVWVGETAKNPIRAEGIKIVRIDGDKIIYTTAGGAQVAKPLAQAQQIAVDDEPAFNKGEEAYRDSKWSDAVDSYQKAVQTSAKEWVKDRASMRLVEVAGKTNRFDAAVTAYVALVQKDPALASKARPAVPDATSKYLDPAVVEVSKALESTRLSDSQRSALLGFLLEIYRAKKDTANVNQTLQQLVKLGAASPADMALLKLAAARVALDVRDFSKATLEIQQNRPLFTEAVSQVEALFILAQAQDGIDGGKDEATVLKDLAIAYVRAATFARDLPGQPHLAEALLRVAQLQEKLKEPQVALQLYQQIAREHAEHPAADYAKAAVERLGKGT